MSRGRHRLPARARTVWRGEALALGAVGVAVLSSAWTGASADPPAKYGWWAATNAGAPVSPPPPPDVPDKGMYVENGFAGPTAISALSFSVPTGATVGNLSLVATGNPVMTSAPTACVTTAEGSSFQSAQNGAWSDAPAYDCGAGKADGSIGADGKTVTFAVAPLVRNGTLDVVILATGQADRIPFEPPGDSALAVSAPATGGSVGAAGSGGLFGPAAGAGTSSGSTTGGQVPAAPPPPQSDVTTNAAPDAGVAPSLASPQPSGPANTMPTGTRSAAASTGAGGRHTVATVLGLIAVVAALVFWSEGFGLLGGRTATLSAPRRRLVPYPDDPAAKVGPQSAAAHS